VGIFVGCFSVVVVGIAVVDAVVGIEGQETAAVLLVDLILPKWC